MANEIGNWGERGPSARHTTRESSNAFKRHLMPDERLVWSSRGKGHSGNRSAPGFASATDIAALGAAVIIVILMSALTTRPSSGILVGLLCCFFVAVSVLPRFLFGQALMVYGLTNKRLMIANRHLFGAVASFDSSKIDRLIVNDYDGRGDVTFREANGDFLTLQPPGDPGDSLVGINDPERVARLIQSTLNLRTPVELLGRKPKRS